MSMDSIAPAGLGLILLFVILLLLKKKRTSNGFLLLFFVLVGCELVYRWLKQTGLVQTNVCLIALDLYYWALLGPAMYLYALFLIRKDRRIGWKTLVHVLPAVLVTFPFVQYLVESPPNTPFFSYLWQHGNLLNQVLLFFIWELSVAFYNVLILISIRRNKSLILNYYSSVKKKDLRWLMFLSGGFLSYVVISLILITLIDFKVLHWAINFDPVMTMALVLYLLGVGAMGVRQEGIFSEHAWLEVSNLSFPIQSRNRSLKESKYARSGMNGQENRLILQRLDELMKTKKPYMNSELDIQELVSHLNTTVHKISQVINANMNQNFFDYINSHRLEEVKKQLRDPGKKHLKVLALAYDCGFNSKSSFYSAFRKATGVSPLLYRQRFRQQQTRLLAT
jgi:AraC-like DNA-binding protein